MAAQIAAGILGAGMSYGTSAFNNYLAGEREHAARMENFELGEHAAGNADLRTRNLYADLQSPKALMQQYKEAGLSPSLMFGDGGAGSVGQGAQGTGAAGISPNVFGVNALDAAQIGLIAAQTQKTQEETKNIAKDTDLKAKEIDKVVAETKNTELQQVWQEIRNGIEQMNLNLLGEYGEEQIKNDIEKQEAEIRNLGQILRKLTSEGDIAEQTKSDIIAYTKDKVLKQQAEIFLIRTQKRLTEAQINLTQQQADTLFEQLQYIDDYVDISRRGVKVQEDRLEAQIDQWAKENGFRDKALKLALTKIIMGYIEQNEDQFINTLTSLIGLNSRRPNKISGLQ